ncbi:MAG: hypothetical protein ACREYE_04660 [Gammaproteobacteria bacterium]
MAAPGTGRPTERRGYRIKRDFDEIDRSDFRNEAFNAIYSYFQAAIAEIDSIEGIRGRFVSIAPQSFGCTVVNRGMDRGTAHITVYTRSGNMGFGDIYYSFSENASPNTANGGYNIESDEYDLFLTSGPFEFGEPEKRLSPEQAAERLWTKFLEQAGAPMTELVRFRCKNCGHRFEAEVLDEHERRAAQQTRQPTAPVNCPKCNRTDFQRGWE